MTKSHYARSIKLECELEQVKKERDALLVVLKDVIGWIPGRKAWHTDEPIKSVERARAVIAEIELTKGG